MIVNAEAGRHPLDDDSSGAAPHRPALRYFGGKWRLAPWVISHFPEHVCYVEAFAGAASVLLRKKPSRFEYLNDADGRVVNFFQQLRDHRGELERRISLTPFSRLEFFQSREMSNDPMEDARRFYVFLWQGRGGHERSTGWRFQRKHARNKTAIADFLDTSHLDPIAQRLRLVGIEHDDAFAVLRRYDGPGTLHYVDPPYIAGLRSKTCDRYRVEFKTEGHHELLLALLSKLTGYVVLSHPRCDLYEDLLGKWRQRTKIHVTGGTDGKGMATKVEEVLWLNPQCSAAQIQGELFSFPAVGASC